MRSLFPFFVVVAACSSSSTPSPIVSNDCPSAIVGDYSLLRKVDKTQPNTCNLTDDATPTNVHVATDGAITFTGTAGSCHGTPQGCNLTAQCRASLKDGGNATLDIAWTFDRAGFHGSTTLTQSGGATACESTSVDTGTRK